jgi:Uncharacterised nucleotidyltransferase
MNLHPNTLAGLEPDTALFYRDVLKTLTRAEVPFLVGGAYALAVYTGIERHTKDLDIFVRPADCEQALEVLGEIPGVHTEVTFPHWLAKAFHLDNFIDIIFSSGNGIATVDDEWFTHAVRAEVVGEPVYLCPVEETLWAKCFIMERERYDGADVAHLLRACAPRLHWPRVLRRFGPHWRVLLSHLVLFGFIYPGERDKIPPAVMDGLLARLRRDAPPRKSEPPLCNGTLLSREQYLIDIEKWGYQDPRLLPAGTMTDEQIIQWTDAIYTGK